MHNQQQKYCAKDVQSLNKMVNNSDNDKGDNNIIMIKISIMIIITILMIVIRMISDTKKTKTKDERYDKQ